MPTYQYACTACGDQLEAVQSFTDAALTDCPACGGALRKVFSAVGVVFKGSGFYKNDSRKPAGTAASSGDSGGSEKSSDKSSDKKGDAAPKKDAAAASSTSSEKGSGRSGNPSSTSSTPAAKSA
ncbi:MAG: FmdB family zinc ribbon protein [Mycobacteriales bacterium]